MQRYGNLSGNSGISGYRLAKDSITLRFLDGSAYLYNTSAPGRTHVAAMKRLAIAGKGLATYVNQHVRENFAAKLE